MDLDWVTVWILIVILSGGNITVAGQYSSLDQCEQAAREWYKPTVPRPDGKPLTGRGHKCMPSQLPSQMIR